MQGDVDYAGCGAVLRQVEMVRTRNVLSSRTRFGLENVAEITRFVTRFNLAFVSHLALASTLN